MQPCGPKSGPSVRGVGNLRVRLIEEVVVARTATASTISHARRSRISARTVHGTLNIRRAEVGSPRASRRAPGHPRQYRCSLSAFPGALKGARAGCREHWQRSTTIPHRSRECRHTIAALSSHDGYLFQRPTGSARVRDDLMQEASSRGQSRTARGPSPVRRNVRIGP